MTFQDVASRYAREMQGGEKTSHHFQLLDHFFNQSIGQVICSFLEGLQALHIARHPCLAELRKRYDLPNRIEPWELAQDEFCSRLLAGRLAFKNQAELKSILVTVFQELNPQNLLREGDVPVDVLVLHVRDVVPSAPRVWSADISRMRIVELIDASNASRLGTLTKEDKEVYKSWLMEEYGLTLGLQIGEGLAEAVRRYIREEGGKTQNA